MCRLPGSGEEGGRVENDSLSALVSHSLRQYSRRSSSLQGNVSSYGKIYENLKGQAIC